MRFFIYDRFEAIILLEYLYFKKRSEIKKCEMHFPIQFFGVNSLLNGNSKYKNEQILIFACLIKTHIL